MDKVEIRFRLYAQDLLNWRLFWFTHQDFVSMQVASAIKLGLRLKMQFAVKVNCTLFFCLQHLNNITHTWSWLWKKISSFLTQFCPLISNYMQVIHVSIFINNYHEINYIYQRSLTAEFCLVSYNTLAASVCSERTCSITLC